MTKLAGAALIFFSAGYWCLLRQREGRALLMLARALLEDLSVLGSRIRLCRTPLPELLEELEGPGADRFWRPLSARLALAEGDTLSRCWAAAAADLPEPLEQILAPLGALLSAGGAQLEKAVEETREELTGFLREETARQADQGRVHAALCLSGASLAVLVLL